MSLQNASIDKITAESSGGNVTAIVVECSMTDDRGAWSGQYRFVGEELQALPSNATQRKAAIRARIQEHLRGIYPEWVKSFSPPTTQDIGTAGIAAFTAQELT